MSILFDGISIRQVNRVKRGRLANAGLVVLSFALTALLSACGGTIALPASTGTTSTSSSGTGSSGTSSSGTSSSGSGTTTAAVSYSVALTWDAPSSSPDPIVGYNIYRSIRGSASYEQLNPSAISQTSWSDNGVTSGQTLDYYVTSVDASGMLSAPSEIATVVVP